jgi:hypothetical protein
MEERDGEEKKSENQQKLLGFIGTSQDWYLTVLEVDGKEKSGNPLRSGDDCLAFEEGRGPQPPLDGRRKCQQRLLEEGAREQQPVVTGNGSIWDRTFHPVTFQVLSTHDYLHD